MHPSYYGLKVGGAAMGVNVSHGLQKYVKFMMGLEEQGKVAAPNFMVHPFYVEL